MSRDRPGPKGGCVPAETLGARREDLGDNPGRRYCVNRVFFRTLLGARGRAQARFGEACAGCPLAPRCTTSRAGRIVEITAAEDLLGRARAARWTDEFRDRYGERSRIERKAAQLKYRNPKVPWRGLVKADAWLKLKVAAMNLDRIGRLGLVGA